MDCSFPPGNAVNDYIDKNSYLGIATDLKYPSVDKFSALIRKKGAGSLLFKRDLRKAYRQIKIDPRDIPMLGFMWQGQLFFYTVLAMGLRSAAFICQRMTNAINYIYHNMGYSAENYIDDFGGCERAALAWEAFAALHSLFQLLGVEEAENKAVAPNVCMIFLGIQFNTIDMTMSIDSGRLTQISEELDSWLGKETATRKELESLIGQLNFVAKCVRPSRVFMARLFNCLSEAPTRGSFFICEDVKLDIEWWAKFLPDFNGVSLIPALEWAEVDAIIESDACLSGGGAVNYASKEFFSTRFPEHIEEAQLAINELELLTILLALKVWGYSLTGARLQLHCDNIVSVSAMNLSRIHNKFMQELMREVVYVQAVCQIEIKTVHIPGVENRRADQLSRSHLDPNIDFTAWEENGWSRVRILRIPDHFALSKAWK